MHSDVHGLVAVPIALGAAVSFAVANVAQMSAARRAPSTGRLGVGLLGHLIRDRVWLLGFLASVAGFGLQAVALYLAPVVLVQPLIVTELLFALPMAASRAGARLGRREWTGTTLVATGLGVFVAFGKPSGQAAQVSLRHLILAGASLAMALVVLIALAERRPDRPTFRASALAAAASICFGYMAILTKVVGHEFADRKLGALAHAPPWMLAVVAVGGLLLVQTAFRIAPLSVSLPIVDIGEPLVASLLAMTILGESVQLTSATVAAVVVAGAGVVAGVALLDSSPMVQAMQKQIARRTADVTRPSRQPELR